jgi:broad specificity phosphatase PhoE
MPVVYYIRHGETEWNAMGRLQGAQDIPLNALGRRQAANAGGILADLIARDGYSESSLVFIASPLSRARLTMELVRATMNLSPDDYALDDRLREIGYGRWEGSTLAQMRRPIPNSSPGARPINGRCRRLAARAMPRCRPG